MYTYSSLEKRDLIIEEVNVEGYSALTHTVSFYPRSLMPCKMWRRMIGSQWGKLEAFSKCSEIEKEIVFLRFRSLRCTRVACRKDHDT
jgi:hypothetical protein